MSSPKPEQFEEFFRAVYGREPFPWQKRLAARACGGDWPRAIALPTAAGKTACLDVAVFALACRLEGIRQPRRIFFVVDRRIVVDQAWMHAKKLAQVLRDAESGILKGVADALRTLTGEEKARPLDVYALRGGMYRESAWTRSPLQPTVIASTVDQVGSRLLFRGYGVSDSMNPVHAGLVGNDSLILLDEAHCAKPFDQTMQAVKSYRTWGEPNPAPFHFVSLTATPTEDVVKEEEKRKAERPMEPKLIEEDEADDRDEAKCVLGKRINAKKPAVLVSVEKVKGKSWDKRGPLVEALAAQACGLMGQDLGRDENGKSHAVRAVGVIVNRVATARRLAEILRTAPGKKATTDPQPNVILLTGRMRPLDRDRILGQLDPLFSGKSGEVPQTYVVATQCLEVGADLDFHALVTECASLDALRQRFGRLNRVAARPGAKAVIVIRGDQTEAGTEDPVYGCSLSNAWQWLNDNADGKTGEELPWIDFGVSSIRAKWAATTAENREAVNAPSPDAPVLFPAHLDCWVQTHPIPTPDPDPTLFLHGPQSGQPDVQVVFRADLGTDPERWAEIVSLCPPSSSEAVPVPIGVFKKWLADELESDDTADVEGETPDEPDERADEPRERRALRWRGPEEGEDKTKVVSEAKEVTPTDAYVIPCDAPDASRLGDFPPGAIEDYAQQAFQTSRDRAALRLLALVIPEDAGKGEETELLATAIEELRGSLQESPEWQRRAVEHFSEPGNLKRRELDRHPLGGYVLTGKNRLHRFDPTYLDDSEATESFRGRAVTLEEHSRGVAAHATRFAAGCGLEVGLYAQAGLWHDLGKLDPRFQAMLKQRSPQTAVGTPLAKSGRSPGTKGERDQARAIHKYPKGARHELLSAALVAAKYAPGSADDLLLHLIATHHGSARPFAGAVTDRADDPDATRPFAPKLFDQSFPSDSYRQQIRAWNAELPERFWRVVRKYGWWGSAYREAVFRLADHAQSAAEQEREETSRASVPTAWVALPAKAVRHDRHPLPLTGLDGSNPLGFLAALGTLVACDQVSRTSNAPNWLTGVATLSWGAASPNTPVLHLPGSPPSPRDFTRDLAARLPNAIADHPSAWAVQMLENEYPQRLRADTLRCKYRPPEDRPRLEWVSALICDSVPEAASQLQTVRRDYLLGNLRSVMQRTNEAALHRCLFETWDYADALDNQSLHWEPTEDRRHAYQWHQPNGDPTRKRRGGMLGANRLALEAWPLFPSFPDREPGRVRTRGFLGTRAANTFWIWPLWGSRLTPDGVASILSLEELQSDVPDVSALRDLGVTGVYRSQRILVGKTPNLTPTDAVG